MSSIKVFYDTETTGLKPGSIAQFSAIKAVDGRVTECKNLYFAVNGMTDWAIEVTGRNDADYAILSHGEKFADRADEIAEFIRGAQLYGYNVSFDNKFLKAEFDRIGRFNIRNGFLTGDTNEIVLTENDVMDKCSLNLNFNSMGLGNRKRAKLSEIVAGLRIDENKVARLAATAFKLDRAVTFHDATYDTMCTFLVNQAIDELVASGYKDSATLRAIRYDM